MTNSRCPAITTLNTKTVHKSTRLWHIHESHFAELALRKTTARHTAEFNNTIRQVTETQSTCGIFRATIAECGLSGEETWQNGVILLFLMIFVFVLFVQEQLSLAKLGRTDDTALEIIHPNQAYYCHGEPLITTYQCGFFIHIYLSK